MSRDNLFTKGNISAAMENQKRLVREDAMHVPASQLHSVPADKLASDLFEKHKINIPVLDVSNPQPSQREVEIVHNRNVHGRGWSDGRQVTLGTEVSIAVPFTGDPPLFQVQPMTSTFGGVEGKVSGQSIVFTRTGTNLDGASIRSEFDRWIAEVQRHLDWHKEALGNFNEQLHALAKTEIDKRLQKLKSDENVLSNLGFPSKG